MPTDRLTRVEAFDANLRNEDGTLWFRLPKALPAGWYVVTLPSSTRPIQSILQVTDLAGFLAVSGTKTLVWANDLASGRPIPGARVTAGSADLGQTDADGVRIVDTPAGLAETRDGPCGDDCSPVVTVRSDSQGVFLPVNRAGDGEDSYGGPSSSSGDRYWHAFDTDRTLYRRTDRINVWGTIRERESGRVPGSVTIRLFATGPWDTESEGAPLATTEARPNGIGVFTSSVALDDVPEGSYSLVASVAGEVIDTRGIRVDRILKPAYQLDVATGRRVYVAGDTVKVTATATFFEGSAVPGVPLRLDGLVDTTFTTDRTGTATTRTTVRVGRENEVSDGDVRFVSVSPARAEEGEISGASQEIVVFASAWTVDADARVEAGRVSVSGAVHAIDRDRLERELAGGQSIWDLDPRGAPIDGTPVTARFTEFTEHRVQTGTRYSFIEKQVVPVYEYETSRRTAGTVQIRTGRDGTFAASIPVAGSGHSYTIDLSATDPDRHVARWSGWASEPASMDDADEPSLVLTSGSDAPDDAAFGIGDAIDLTMSDPGPATGPADRYLFFRAQGGLRDAAVQSSPRYRETFPDWAPPGIWIHGVRFTGSGYSQSPGFRAAFRQTDREIRVALTTDGPRYDPGEEVTLTVSTRDPSGKPIPATVVLRGVDEKLFRIGGAEAADPLAELYRDIDPGIVATYRSHHEPDATPGDGGDTGGGGDDSAGRQDFRDEILFRDVQTGPNGSAVVSFRVADDLTAWRISASAFGEGHTAGETSIAIPVGLPFFVDATIASEYVVSDRPAIGLRAFGTSLQAGADVTFAVDSDSLGLHVKGRRAKAFDVAAVDLPKLSVGTHTVTITATTGSGATARRDVMTRTFTVVPSRLARTRTAAVELTGSAKLDGGNGRVEVIVSDAGASRHLDLLLGLTDVDSARLERRLAATVAASLVRDRYGLADAATLAEFDRATYQRDDGGVGILPYSSSDVGTSALVALVAPDRIDGDRLAEYLSEVISDPKATRERRLFALAGLAGLHEPVLPRVRAAAADPDLTVREQLMLGLGAAALGDAATARTIAARLVSQSAEVTADLARLRVGKTSADITAATALMAMLTAATGDVLAPRFWATIEADPGTEAPYALHAVGFVTRLLERGALRAASFAYTIGETRETVALDPGDTFHLSLAPMQFAALTIEPLSGRVGVTTSWAESVKPSAVPKDPDIKISRKITPSGTVGAAKLVRVDLTVELGPKAPTGCHLVTDLVPSGLVPVGHLEGWVDPNQEEVVRRTVDYPFAQVGQRVSFCAERTAKSRVAHLRYFARVVTTGTYAWEPAIAESRTKAGRAALTGATVVRIR